MIVKFTELNKEFHQLKKNLTKSFLKVGKTGQFVFGQELDRFEKEVQKFLKVKYALGVGNWTEGMGLVCKALNFKQSDEIITVSNSFVATCGAIAYNNIKPVLVDINEDLNIDPRQVIKKITKNTKAVMPVHLSGIPSSMNELKKICEKRKLVLIEDAAHSFGSKLNNKFVGTIGDVGIFSLHPRKNFHVFGDGGIIVTNNKQIYKKLKLLRNHGLINRDEAVIWGTNSRLDNIQASFGNLMLKKINLWNKKHLNIANYYTKNLKKYVQVPIYDLNISNPTFHQYIIRTKKRNELSKYLKTRGIETAVHYPNPIHKQRAYINSYGKISLPITEKYSKQILSLPIHNSLNKKKIVYVVECIKNFFLYK